MGVLNSSRPGLIYPRCRHLSLVILCGSIFMFVTDLFPFMFSFFLSFEYGCLFYPALVSFIYSCFATAIFWRKELITEEIPTMIVIGWAAIVFMILQLIFCLVADFVYHFDVIVTGSGYLNAAAMFYVAFRLWCLPQAVLIFWLGKWANIMYKNPGAEQEFLYAMRNKGKKLHDTASSSAGPSEFSGSKAQEATV